MTKSTRLCVWQGDPVGQEEILRPGEHIWPAWYYDKSPSKWEFACNILQCRIAALCPGMIPPTSSIISLWKMTPCPEESRPCAEARRSSSPQKKRDLKECRFNFLNEWLRHYHRVLFFSVSLSTSLQSEVFFPPLCSQNKTWPWTNDADRPECSSNQVCGTTSPNKHFSEQLPGNIKLKSLKKHF